jgi:hypothetical protein
MRFITGLLVALIYDSLVFVVSALIVLRQAKAAGATRISMPPIPGWWWALFFVPPILFLFFWMRAGLKDKMPRAT